MPYLAVPKDLILKFIQLKESNIAIAYIAFSIHKLFKCSSYIVHFRTVLISVKCRKIKSIL